MEPYEDLMVYDDPLLDEIREVVTRPPSSVVLPAAARIGRPMQRTVMASVCCINLSPTTSASEHKITRAAPDGSGPLPLGKEWTG